VAGVGARQLQESLELIRLDLELGDDHEWAAVRAMAGHQMPPGRVMLVSASNQHQAR
jgi:hypothetical protein